MEQQLSRAEPYDRGALDGREAEVTTRALEAPKLGSELAEHRQKRWTGEPACGIGMHLECSSLLGSCSMIKLLPRSVPKVVEIGHE
jgi:hypothetical protein